MAILVRILAPRLLYATDNPWQSWYELRCLDLDDTHTTWQSWYGIGKSIDVRAGLEPVVAHHVTLADEVGVVVRRACIPCRIRRESLPSPCRISRESRKNTVWDLADCSQRSCPPESPATPHVVVHSDHFPKQRPHGPRYGMVGNMW